MTNGGRGRRPALPKGCWAVATVIVVLALAGALSYFLFDESAISWLAGASRSWHSNVLALALRQLGKSWVPVWFLLLWLYLSGRVRPALTALLALLLLLPVVQPLKVVVGRPRPVQVIAASEQALESDIELRGHSFPSGDTASAFAVATALAGFLGWPWLLMFFALSTGVGLLRVAVLVHYPSDVFGGAAIGILCGFLALQITRRWLSSESSRPSWCRSAAVIGLVVLPACIWLFQGSDDFVIFLKTYAVLGVIILAIAKLRRLKSPPENC